MKKEDIALTVAGVLASMALAYLFYRQQTKTPAAAAQDQTDPAYYTTQGLYEGSMVYQQQYASQLPSASASTTTAAQVDTSASTAETGNAPTTDMASLLAEILEGFHASSDTVTSDAGFASLAIQPIDTQPLVSTSGIPTTAIDALANAQNAIQNPPGVDVSNPPVAVVSSPILVTTGAGGLLDTQTAATPAPSITAVHANHIRTTSLAEAV